MYSSPFSAQRAEDHPLSFRGASGDVLPATYCVERTGGQALAAVERAGGQALAATEGTSGENFSGCSRQSRTSIHHGNTSFVFSRSYVGKRFFMKQRGNIGTAIHRIILLSLNQMLYEDRLRRETVSLLTRTV